MKIRIFLKKYGISILLCLIILYLCLMDTQSLPKVKISNFDKFVHFTMFLTLSGVIYFENSRYFRRKISFWKMVNFSFIFPIIYGGLIEIGQEYLAPTRSGDWADFVFNGIGAFTGLMICLQINKRL